MASGRGFTIKESLFGGIAMVGSNGVKMGSVDFYSCFSICLAYQDV